MLISSGWYYYFLEHFPRISHGDNNPCEIKNKDIWTFEGYVPSMSMGYGRVKDFAYYEDRPGCCKKFASVLKRDKLQLIMEMMKHSLGTPIPDEKFNPNFDELSLVRPTDEVIRKIEEK